MSKYRRYLELGMFLHQGSSQYLWYELVQEAGHVLHCYPHALVSCALVGIIEKYQSLPYVFFQQIALQSLSCSMLHHENYFQLQRCAEVTLLLAGLFPARCRRHGIPLNDRIQLCQRLYQQLATEQ